MAAGPPLQAEQIASATAALQYFNPLEITKCSLFS
jgi:hypothetical protein